MNYPRISVFAIASVLLALPGFGQQAPRVRRRARATVAPDHYALMLADPPVSSRFSTRAQMATAAAIGYRQQIEAQQQNVRRELASRNIPVVGSVSTLLNAIFVTAPSSRVAELRSIPGVIAVRPMRRGHRHINRATQLMNAPAAWNTLGGVGNAGAGIKIAILDTGIDQTHPAFQDSSLQMPAGFPKCTNGHPEDCAYTNNKVIVARSYVRQIAAGIDPSNPAATSTPDDFSPRDRDGHGTAVASVAAAAVNSGAVTFNGMAPKAYLGNYKVYGTDGVNDFPSEDIFIMAIEDALNDGMDVANFSSGLPALSGALDKGAACGIANGAACDPLASAFEAAAHAGMAIAVSAGNEGNLSLADFNGPYPSRQSIASPATAPSVITAGATLNSHVMQPSVSVNSPSAPANLKNIAASMSDSAFFPSVFGANDAPLIDVATVAGNSGGDPSACGTTNLETLPAFSLHASYALIEASSTPGCDFSSQAFTAEAAGAVGIVFYSGGAGALTNPENILFTGPVVLISNGDGVALKSYIDANPGQMVTIDTAGVEQELSDYSSKNNFIPALQANQLASFSSIGPTPDGAIKPDLVATGGFDLYQSPDPHDYSLPAPSGMYTAAQSYDPSGELFSTNRYVAANGTSFSAPLAAGAAALVKQAHPGFTGVQIKSALVNSASASSTTTDDLGNRVDVESAGAGLLNAGAAVSAIVTAVPSSFSLGFLKGAALPVSKMITLTNTGTGTLALNASIAQNTPSTGTTLALDHPTVTLAASATATLTLSISGSVPAAGKYSGSVTLQGGGVTLQVPYMYVVGDGIPYNVNPVLPGVLGTTGQDAGTIALQVTDRYGAPVVNTPVSFVVDPPRTVTLQSVDGEPACSPAQSSARAACNTDNYGIAYAEAILGNTPGFTNINVNEAGVEASFQAFILAPPSISAGGIVNAATNQGAIAPGSYIAIYGANLVDSGLLVNPSGDVASQFTSTGALPLQIDEVSVSFDVPSAGISLPAHMYFVSPGQVNVHVPWEIQGQKSVQMKVTIDEGIFSNVVTVPVADYTPSFFGTAAQIAALDEKNQLISAANPVQGGHVAQIYCNGLGPVSNPPASGDPAPASPLSMTTTQPTVTIGGQPAQVQFSGLAPGFAGLYQVNVIVPAGLASGSQPVVLTINGQTSNTSMIAVK